MDKDKGKLCNESTGVKIHVQRLGKKWAVDLEDLSKAMRANPVLEKSQAEDEMVQAYAVINREPKSTRVL